MMLPNFSSSLYPAPLRRGTTARPSPAAPLPEAVATRYRPQCRATRQKDIDLKSDAEHARNDRIEAAVLLAALATLCLLVAIAVSTSIIQIRSEPDLQADTPDPGRTGAGIEAAEAPPDQQTLR